MRIVTALIAALVALAALAGCAADAPPRDQDSSGWTLHVHVDQGDVRPQGERLELRSGDTLTLVVDADEAGELHVHSKPEQHVEFPAGSSTHRLRFDVPGMVEIEDHASDTVIAQIAVT